MTAFRWTLRIIVVVLVGLFLHYTLPQRDIVRVTGTEVIRQDFSGLSAFFYAQQDEGTTAQSTRDVRFINAIRPNNRVIVYRNEDTGLFGWPPYFKIDSANLQAEASNAISTAADPRWYVVTHYGWRFNAPTIYPNAVSMRQVEGPDVTLIPWFNIMLILGLLAIWRAIYVRWRRFREKRISPLFNGA
ncbi:MAG: DUF1523 family protein [Shimia sp.]